MEEVERYVSEVGGKHEGTSHLEIVPQVWMRGNRACSLRSLKANLADVTVCLRLYAKCIMLK